jgi:glycosyltransferase involved in cell wall biosynthesis|tara:strand:- start:403 stop:1050 length:648 start_codon:yes stop_codon:yes gene_type:complete
MGSKFGFLVRTKNEEKWVGYALQSIKDHFPGSDVVIVDNESTDDSMSIARMFQPKVATVPKNEYSPGKSLNLGFSKLDCDYVCCISAHCEVIQVGQKLESYLNQDGCFGVIGKQRPIYKGRRLTPKNAWNNFSHDKCMVNLTESDDTEDPFFHNAFSFIPMRVWEEQPFCEIISGKEDRHWAKIMKGKGLHSIYDPDTLCDHHWTHGCATWKGMG